MAYTLCAPTTARGPVVADPRAWARQVWFGVAAGTNAALALVLLAQDQLVDHAVEASLLTLGVAVAARHDAMVGGLFALGRIFPSYRLHQLTYHVGQLHRAMAVAATMWFALAVIAAAADGDGVARAVGAVVLALLAAMTATARDAVRHRRHDRFEVVHRYGGWASLAMVGVLVLRHGTGPSIALFAVVVGLVAHPWAGVRRLPAEILSVTADVVVVALPGRRSLGEFVRVSRDGREWHCFAVATTGTEGPGRFCLVIRRAGDWTDQLARDAARGRGPAELLVRRMRGHGFMDHARAWRRVLIVATGAGIGPVLPYLLGESVVDLECLWIGRDHRLAMGDELVERVLAGGRVTLVDTAAGRPDVAALVAAAAGRHDAVFVVSNEQVRDVVARTCEGLGVAWYGPTFDS